MDGFYLTILNFLNGLFPSAIAAEYLDMNEFLAYCITLVLMVYFILIPCLIIPYKMIKKLFK